jgi:3-hydroxyisobutyrate dehydrogenase-like beta-hydroxyacid dehydrogenase
MRLVTRAAFSFARVGFIGLGNMGFPMAINLAAKGHSVFAYDIDPAKAQEAVQHKITFHRDIR